ncbi:MAG TPA: glycosyltransferase family 39 protein [Candidatus Levybacteria bacterium]|nr:glycosyltransferase family 39 protein [Candidatus Levybacteria bacterium]
MKKLRIYTKKSTFLLVLLLILGTLLRFYNLNWGAPYYFHPDERNIASAIDQLHFPDNLNPKFFAYGSIPIYITYSIGIVINSILSITDSVKDIFDVSFEQAILIGRFFSATLSVGTILLLYKTARMFVSQRFSLLAAFLATCSVGLIQYAHFGTFEMYLTFFSLLLLYVLIKYQQSHFFKYFLYSIFIIGILTAIKISSLILFPLPLLLAFNIALKKRYRIRKMIFIPLSKSIISILFVGAIFVVTNPFVLLDFQSFSGSIQYESGVATGSIPVFYTGTFYNTVPILFQSLYVMPFLLNPVVWIFVLPALTILCIQSLKKSNQHYRLILIFFLFLFIPQAILFVKWTRYMVPTLPILYLIIVIFLSFLQKSIVSKKPLYTWIIPTMSIILISSSIIWTGALVKTVYSDTDTRVAAAQAMIPRGQIPTTVLSEVYDMGIVPFDIAFSDIHLFDFYHIEDNQILQQDLPSLLSQSDIFILPSQRLIKSRTLNNEKFSHGNRFYQSVQTSSRFSQIYKTPCDVWCSLLYLGDPVYGVEETANVFDRPTVSIYKISTK